jgi:glucosamine 6-phosphate synthetase-like amidotransferase/phosphosugar isomerase protein
MLYKIQQAVNSQGHSVEIISTALSHLEGTFGLWIINTDYRGVYIARCGSTLFANKIDNTFSSVKFKGSEAIEEGVVYEVTPEGLTSVANFDFNSPFFS